MEDQKVKPFAVSGDLPVGKEKREGLGTVDCGTVESRFTCSAPSF